MFKRILVAIDGSPTSTRAFKQALALAQEQGAALHVLHVIDEAPNVVGYEGAGYLPQDYFDRLAEGLRKDGQKVLARAEAAAAKTGQTVHTILIEGGTLGVAQAVLTQAHKIRADLIVLGTHGRRGLKRLVMGSDAEAVVREAPVPVLLVRAEATTRPPELASTEHKASPRVARTAAPTGGAEPAPSSLEQSAEPETSVTR